MRDVTRKIDSLRSATAEATLRIGPTGMRHLREGTLPKGEPFAVCQVAGMLAAKKTSELIPHCHNIPLDSCDIRCVITEEGVVMTAETKTVWKTGVEMEALTAVTVAALTLYDLLKPVETEVVILETKLLTLAGGMSAFGQQFSDVHPTFAVLVASDRASEGTYLDKSGVRIGEILTARGATQSGYRVLPDDEAGLAEQLRGWVSEGISFIFTTGGTGIAPRDCMVEATRSVIAREVPGIAEAMRSYSQRRKPVAMFSRGIAGVAGQTLIINLPGSTKGVEETLEAILPMVFHAVDQLAGGGHEASPATLPAATTP